MDRLLGNKRNNFQEPLPQLTRDELDVSESRYKGLFDNSPISLWEEDFSGVKQRLDQLALKDVSNIRSYLESHPEFVNECIAAVKIIDVNQATLALYEAKTKEELISSLDLIIPSDAREEFINELVYIAKGVYNFEWEGINQTLSGKPIHARIRWSVVPGNEDSLSKVVISLEDVTKQKQYEQQLRENEEKYRLLIENMPIGICRTTNIGTGKFLMANPAMVNLLGYDSEEELMSVPVSDIYVDPGDRQLFAQELMARGRHSGVELHLKKKNGEHLWVSVTSRVQYDPSNNETYFDCSITDVTERRKAESHSKNLASKLKAVASVTRQITILKSIDSLSEDAIASLKTAMNSYNANLFMVKDGKLVFVAGQGGYEPDFIPVKGMEIGVGHGIIWETVKTGQPVLVNNTLQDARYQHWAGLPHTRSELAVPIRSGDQIVGVLDVQSIHPNAYEEADVEALSVLGDQLAIALENARLFEQTRRRANELEAMSDVSTALRMASSPSEILDVTLDQISELFDVQASAVAFIDPTNKSIRVEAGRGVWESRTGEGLPAEQPFWEYVIATGQPHLNNAFASVNGSGAQHSEESIKAIACVPLITQESTIGALTIGNQDDIAAEDLRALSGIGDMLANAIQRSTLHEQTQRYAQQMAKVSLIGRSLAETLNSEEIYERLGNAVLELFSDVSVVLISEYNATTEMITCTHGIQDGQQIKIQELPPLPLAPQNQGTQSWVIRERKPLIVDDLPNKLTSKYSLGKTSPATQSAMYAPLLVKDDVLGLIQVQSYTPARFKKSDVELLVLVANTGAIALENAKLFADINQRIQRMSALRTMDMAISSSFDLRVTLNVLLDQVTSQLNVDAACVLLYRPQNRTLEYAAGRGFRSASDNAVSLRLDQSLAGRVALERRVLHIANMRHTKGTRPLQHTFLEEDFISYYAIPLIVKGQVKGVLEIYHRAPINPDTEWNEFIETLASDAAIAIDNSALFNDLQRSNVELTLAYDRTLEGWSRALELRDEETEGHAHRVNQMTLKLAVSMGMSESELQHVRRGALLHDIGKMGVPDDILRKTGPLTEDEWVIMRRHPVDAYELLSRIPYLKPALDIPYCHHERWDGTGYPNGLKGEEIPLAARIFAIVDVWDALLSKRPYRDAWPEDKVLAHLTQQSGLHFDPQVVDRFMHLLGKR